MASAAILVDVNQVHNSPQPLPGTVALIILWDYILNMETPVKYAVNAKVLNNVQVLLPLKLQLLVSIHKKCDIS